MIAKGRSDMEIGYSAAADRIEVEIGVVEGDCLDVGCCVGEGALELKRRWPSTKWIGIDRRYDYVQTAKSKGLFAAVMEMENLPWVEHFDFIFSRHSLEHSFDVTSTLRCLWQAGKVGSYIYFQIPIESHGTKNELHLSPFHDPMECRELLGGHWKEVYWGEQAEVVEFIGKKRETKCLKHSMPVIEQVVG